MFSPSSIISVSLKSDRIGVENMDGQAILASQPKSYTRPWIGCIPFEQLNKNNLPPFYVRLQDDQVGHLAHWVSTSRSSITRLKLGQVWPWDFESQGKISTKRDNWGAEYTGCGKEMGKGLGGGKKTLAWTDPGLPLTYTSSHKVMTKELDALKKGTGLKRKAEHEAGRNARMPVKKPRLGSMRDELTKMKENSAAEKKKREQEVAAKSKGNDGHIRDAMQVVNDLMRSAAETEHQNAALEAMILAHEAQCGKDADDVFAEWLAYNRAKKGEVDRMLEDHAAEIKGRDDKIKALETEAKGCRASLDREKRKVRVRDERLVSVKNRWEEEQAAIERQIETLMMDLDELSEFNNKTDEDEDEDEESDNNDDDGDEEVQMCKTEPEEKKEEEKEEKQTTQQRPKTETEEPYLTKQEHVQQAPNQIKQEPLNDNHDYKSGTPIITTCKEERKEATVEPKTTTTTTKHESKKHFIVKVPITNMSADDILDDDDDDDDDDDEDKEEEGTDEEEEEKEDDGDEVTITRRRWVK